MIILVALISIVVTYVIPMIVIYCQIPTINSISIGIYGIIVGGDQSLYVADGVTIPITMLP